MPDFDELSDEFQQIEQIAKKLSDLRAGSVDDAKIFARCVGRLQGALHNLDGVVSEIEGGLRDLSKFPDHLELGKARIRRASIQVKRWLPVALSTAEVMSNSFTQFKDSES